MYEGWESVLVAQGGGGGCCLIPWGQLLAHLRSLLTLRGCKKDGHL